MAKPAHSATPREQQPREQQPREQQPREQQNVSSKSGPTGNHAEEEFKADSRPSAKRFQGTSDERKHWEKALLEAAEVPASMRPLEFRDRDEAYESFCATIREKFYIPTFKDLAIGWKWHELCLELVARLRCLGQIKYPTERELWMRKARAAKFAAGDGSGDTEARDAADGGISWGGKFKAACDEAYERGCAEGFKKGKTEGRSEAIDKIITVAQQQFRDEEPGNATAPARQLESSLDRLEFEEPASQGTLFGPFGGRQGALMGAPGNGGESSKRGGSVSSSDSHTPAQPSFADRIAGLFSQDPAGLSRSSPTVRSEGPKQSTTPI
ncbi:hypothetical protein IWZ01DRAFT_484946 [Phyllosticta capitalensis]